VKALRYVVLGAGILILQTTLLKLVAIAGIRPDLILFVIFYIAMQEGSYGATIAGFCLGLVQDVYAPETMGLNALCKSLVGFGLGYCQRGIFVENLFARALILFAAVLVHDLLFFLIFHWPNLGMGMGLVIRHGLPTAFYTSVLSYIVFYFLRRREQLKSFQEA
jgi:rod shape-determining protein MreD